MILTPNIVPQQNRSSVVHRNEDIHRAVIIEIADGQSASRKKFAEHRAALFAYILQALGSVPEKK
jgi:hypothetical protein